MTLLEQAKEFYRDNTSDGSETLQEWMAMFAEAAMPKWTYCKDAMPAGELTNVLVSLKNGGILLCTYVASTKNWFVLGLGEVTKENPVIAWMPLPGPAK